MLIDWIEFGPALVLLLTPIALFAGERVSYREISRDWSQHWSRALSHGHHAIDLLRAVLGAWLLTEALARTPGVRGLAGQLVPLTQAGVLVSSVLIQTVVCRKLDSAHAPFAFVVGLLFGFLPPLIAVFGVVIALVIAVGVRAPAAFFPVLALSVSAAGLFFTGRKFQIVLVIAAGAVLLPWLYSLLFRRELVVPYRSRHTKPAVPLPQ